MKVFTRRFNLFLAIMALAGLCGCQSDKKSKGVGALRVHIEIGADNSGTSQMVSVVRSDPMAFNIANEPILTEDSILAAKVIDTRGGFAVQVQFDESSALMLEQYSADNPGKHLVIFGQWSEKVVDGRWLAAPLITHRIFNGLLSFTPDMSREEADRLVIGLNNVAKKIQKEQLK
jgi:preprotein translocase subunit SecD